MYAQHICLPPCAPLQDVEAFTAVVQQWAQTGGLVEGVDPGNPDNGAGNNDGPSILPESRVNSLRNGALQRLKQRTARLARIPEDGALSTAAAAPTPKPVSPAVPATRNLSAPIRGHLSDSEPHAIPAAQHSSQQLMDQARSTLLPMHAPPPPRFMELEQRQALLAVRPTRVGVPKPVGHKVGELPPATHTQGPAREVAPGQHQDDAASNNGKHEQSPANAAQGSLEDVVALAQQLQHSLVVALHRDAQAPVPDASQPVLRALVQAGRPSSNIAATAGPGSASDVLCYAPPAHGTGRVSHLPFSPEQYMGEAGDESINDSGSDAEGFTEQQLLRQLFFAKEQQADVACVSPSTDKSDHLAGASPGGVQTPVSPSTHKTAKPSAARNLGASLNMLSPPAGSSRNECVPKLRASEEEPAHGTPIVEVPSTAQLPQFGPPLPCTTQPHCQMKVVMHAVMSEMMLPGTSLLVKVRASCGTQKYTQEVLSQAPGSHSDQVFSCHLDVDVPASPLQASAAAVIVEVWHGGVGDDSNDAWELLGVATAPLKLSQVHDASSCSPLGRACVDGVFPLVDVLGTGPKGSSGQVGSVSMAACLDDVLVRHVWRVTVCGASELPSVHDMELAALPVPSARYIKYRYPGGSAVIFCNCVASSHMLIMFQLPWSLLC